MRRVLVLATALVMVMVMAAGGRSAVVGASPLAASAAATGPSLPVGLNVAIGAHPSANSASAPGTSLDAAVDGDGTTRWCPDRPGVHVLTVDLGQATGLTGVGVTFSGEEPNDGSTFSVTAGTQPNALVSYGTSTPIVPGPLYVDGAVQARYLRLTYRVPREQNICVQEFRAFSPDPAAAKSLELGADLSTLKADQSRGLKFSSGGVTKPLLDIVKAGGMNYVRLRLWVRPGNSPGVPDLANDLDMAKQIKAAGMKLLLDFHYSDTWADPQHQDTPAAWAGQKVTALAATVHDYTRDVVAAFARQGTPVDQVAIGNEITQGMLWPVGKLVVGSDGTADWGPLTTLLQAGVAGAREGNPAGHGMLVQLHIDRGGDNATSVDFFDHMTAAHVPFDVIGLSYYPWFHGPFSAMKANILDLQVRYRKPILIAEDQFPYAPIGGYGKPGTANYPDTLPGYAITPAGQASYQRDLVSLLATLPKGLGLGVFYWAADNRGPDGFFTTDGAAQPVVDAYRIG